MKSGVMALFCVAGFIGFAALSTAGDGDKDLKKVQGVWTMKSQTWSGKKKSADEIKGVTVTLEGDKFTVKDGEKLIQAGTQKLDSSKTPKTLDATVTEGHGKGTVMLGIYEIDGDMMKVCFDPEGKKRPTEFKSEPDSGLVLNISKRVKK